ncbi:uncharacterized protein UHOD_11841 [Ustilago sp. UG-2017b]|nr:uncharacterized protein UHOD_11841 [Ustilago sp. UG-2017b]
MVVVQSPWRPWTPMDSHAKKDRAHKRGGPGAATKRTKLKEHADGYHSGAREIRVEGTVTGRRRRSSVEGVDTAQEDRGGARGPPVQYSMKKVLSGERAGAASLVML